MVDVRPIGPKGTSVGFATINSWFHKFTGVHMGIYTITDWLGLIPLVICMCFGMVGLIQWIKRKKIGKIDVDLLLLGVYYLIVIAVYLLFEKIALNDRPILIEGRLEASYPSSTTLLTVSVMMTAVWQFGRRIQKVIVKNCLIVASLSFTIFMVGFRLISGVHWLTDIIGGLLISAALISIYILCVSAISNTAIQSDVK